MATVTTKGSKNRRPSWLETQIMEPSGVRKTYKVSDKAGGKKVQAALAPTADAVRRQTRLAELESSAQNAQKTLNSAGSDKDRKEATVRVQEIAHQRRHIQEFYA